MECNRRWTLLLALLLAVVGPRIAWAQGAESSAPFWNVQILQSELATDLRSTQMVMQYGGSLNPVDHYEAPAEGCVFLLVEMRIEKERPGKSVFSWADVYVQDAEGNRYARHPDDTFLEIHGIDRIMATDLTFGDNLGTVCFEIPQERAAEDLTFIYDGTEGYVAIGLDPAGQHQYSMEDEGICKER